MRGGEARQRQQLVQLALAQHRRIQQDVVDVLRAVVEQVALAPDLGRQRHHAVLAQRVDRRVGDLRESLPETVVERAHALADRGHRDVVAHRTGGFLLGLGERPQHRLLFLAGELEQLLEAEQGGVVEGRIGERRVDQLGVQVGHPALEPLLVGPACAVERIDRLVVEQAAAGQVHRDHLARPQLALRRHPARRQLPHTGFGGDHEHAVVGQGPARGAQAVAVERAGRMLAVAHDHAGGPVPWFGVDRVVLVERGEVGVLVFQRLRGRRHQDAHGLGQVHAAEQQPLEHAVQALRVGAMHRHHFVEARHVQQRRAPHPAARLRPAAVAFDAVDLAVVGEPPERMRQRPARQGVGGKALVEHHRARGEARVGEVREQLRQAVRQDHALVAQQARRQPDHVEVGLVAQRLLGALAGQEQLALQRVGVGLVALHEHLFDGRHRRLRQTPAGGGIHRQRAPPGHPRADGGEFGVQAAAAGVRARGVAWQEHVAGGDRAGVQADAGVGGELAHEAFDPVQQHAAAIAGQPVGGDPAAVRHARQRVQGDVDDRARTVARDLRDQAEATTVVFARGVVQTPIQAVLHGGVRRGGARPWRTAPRHRFIRIDHNLCGATTACDGEKTVTKETT